MEEDVRNAVFGNVGTTIAFRVGPFDAEVLETVFAPCFEATDLVNLGFAQIYLTLMIDGIGSHPFSAKTLPPVPRPLISCKEMVIGASRQLYGNEREEVEKVVTALHTPERTEESKRSNDRKPGQGNNQQKRTFGNNVQGQGQSARPDQVPQAPRQNNGNESRSNDSRESRNRPPEKNPQDLRQILAKMATNNDKADTKESVPTKNQVVTSPEVKSPVVEIKERPIPLKATISSQSEVVESSPLRAALADALKNVPSELSTPSKTSSPTPAPKREVTADIPPPQVARQTTEVPPVQSQYQPVASSESAVRRVVLAHRKKLVTMPTEPVASRPLTFTPASVTAAAEQASVPVEEDDFGVDVATIRRMLRSSPEGRSPFQQ